MRIFVMEAMTRAAEQAKKEDSDEISLEHLEKILPQFLLDFAWAALEFLNFFSILLNKKTIMWTGSLFSL